MPPPGVLSDVRVPIPVPSAEASAVTEPLDVRWQEQMGSNWCWAACASMAMDFLKHNTAKQCELAGRLTGYGSAKCCSGSQPPDECDQPCCGLCVGQVYSWCGLACTPYQEGPLGFDALRDIISQRKLIEARIGWYDTQGVLTGRGHLVLLTGWRGAKVRVLDPWYGTSWTRHDILCAAYKGEGRWTHWWKVG